MATSVDHVEQQQTTTVNGSLLPATRKKVDSVMSNSSEDESKARVLGLDEYKEAALSIAEAFQEDDVSMCVAIYSLLQSPKSKPC